MDQANITTERQTKGTEIESPEHKSKHSKHKTELANMRDTAMTCIKLEAESKKAWF